MSSSEIRAVAFDAYGTLFDVFSVSALADEIFPGQGGPLSIVWRDKQIEYTRLRTMSDKYVPFWQVTGDALTYAARALKLDLSAEDHERLMQQYLKLTAFPENLGVLKKLKALGVPMAILTNGNPEMVSSVVESAGMTDLLDFQLSADTPKKFKTHPATYQLSPDAFGVPVENILLVSSNCWDACGATWFGYQTLWVNRANAPLEELGVNPTVIGHTLEDVYDFVVSKR